MKSRKVRTTRSRRVTSSDKMAISDSVPGSSRGHLGAQHLQAQGDGVERILDFMRHASGQAIDGREAAGHRDLALDVAARPGIEFLQRAFQVGAQLAGVFAGVAEALAQQAQLGFDGGQFPVLAGLPEMAPAPCR